MRDYGSHIAPLNMLSACISDVVTKVVELGSGLYSTPMWCNRDLWPCVNSIISYEDDSGWAEHFSTMFNDHRLSLTDVMPDVSNVDIILIDNGHDRKGRLAGIKHVVKQKPSGVVVLHDADDVDYIQAIKSHFKHRIIYTGAFPYTAILWNDEKWTDRIKVKIWET